MQEINTNDTLIDEKLLAIRKKCLMSKNPMRFYHYSIEEKYYLNQLKYLKHELNKSE
jgi:hypothetical protein